MKIDYFYLKELLEKIENHPAPHFPFCEVPAESEEDRDKLLFHLNIALDCQLIQYRRHEEEKWDVGALCSLPPHHFYGRLLCDGHLYLYALQQLKKVFTDEQFVDIVSRRSASMLITEASSIVKIGKQIHNFMQE